MRCQAVAAIVVALLPCAAPAAAPSYTFVPFEVPGASRTYLSGINDAGHVVGNYEGAGGGHGFVKAADAFTTVDVPGAANTHVSGINASGQLVGAYRVGERWHGFLKVGETLTMIDPPGSVTTEPRQITDDGVILGGFVDADSGGPRAFTKDAAGYHTIDVPLADVALTWAVSDVNSGGRMVGFYLEPGWHFRGFERNGDAYSIVHVPGAAFSLAKGIDDAGRIVGVVNVTGNFGDNRPFIKDGEDYYTLPTPAGWSDVEPEDMNAAGVVVGAFTDAAGRQRGFIATPVPEPSASIAAAALAAAAILRRRRRAAPGS